MSSTLISFDGEYYNYQDGKKEEQGLAIGGYESDLLAGLVAPYLFEKSKTLLNSKNYRGIYQDDGLVVLEGKKRLKEVKYWLEYFQKNSDQISGQATPSVHRWSMDAWSEPSLPAKEDWAQIVTNDKFPFLDTDISWSPEGDLQFGVFRQKG